MSKKKTCHFCGLLLLFCCHMFSCTDLGLDLSILRISYGSQFLPTQCQNSPSSTPLHSPCYTFGKSLLMNLPYGVKKVKHCAVGAPYCELRLPNDFPIVRLFLLCHFQVLSAPVMCIKVSFQWEVTNCCCKCHGLW